MDNIKEGTMTREKALKWIGLAGSLLLGSSLILKGQVQEGFGIIAAALSSAGVLSG